MIDELCVQKHKMIGKDSIQILFSLFYFIKFDKKEKNGNYRHCYRCITGFWVL